MAIYKNTPPIVTKGLILYWDGANPISYPSGSATWNDLAGNSYNGLLVSGSSFTSFGGGSFRTNGTTTRITSSFETLPSSSTFEFCINRTNSANDYNMMGGMYLPYFAFRASGIFFFSNRYGGVQRNLSTPLTYLNNTWYNVTFVAEYTGSNVTTTSKIYVNGILATSANYTGSQQSPTQEAFTAGSWRQVITDVPFSGSIAIAKIYNYALSDQEIAQNYNATKTRFNLS